MSNPEHARGILQVTSAAWGGGLESLALDLAKEARRRGWRSHICYHRGEPPRGEESLYLKLRTGGHVRAWPAQLVRLVRRERYDIVHLHGPGPGSLGALALGIGGIRNFIYSDHSLHSMRPISLRVPRRLAANLPRVNVAVSEAVANSLITDAGAPARRTLVIRSGTREAPAAAPPDSSNRKFLFVANFWPIKGHRLLLRAFAKLAAQNSELILIGDGVEQTVIKDEAVRLGIQSRVKMKGYLADPWTFADGAWGYVHPSLGEGLGLALIEAMMRGIPVIATAVGGIPEIVQHEKTGILVAPSDVDALAAALQRLCDDRALRDSLGQEARRYAMSKLRLEDSLDAYFRLYSDLIT